MNFAIEVNRAVFNKAVISLAFASGFCFSTAISSQPIEVAGIVSSIEGVWQATKDKQVKGLHKGSSIPNGWSLKLTSATGRITILRPNGQEFACPKHTRICTCPITVKDSANAVDNLFHGAMSIFSQSPDRWLPSTSRSLSGEIKDGVIQANGTLTDISSMAANFKRTRIFYKLFDLKDKEVRSGTATPGAGKFIIDCSDLAENVYKFNCGDDEDLYPRQAMAYFAIVSKDKYTDVSSKFESARKAVTSKRSPTDDVKKGILRAYLSSLFMDN